MSSQKCVTGCNSAPLESTQQTHVLFCVRPFLIFSYACALAFIFLYQFVVYCILCGHLIVGCRFPKLICASVHVGISVLSVLLLLFVLWSSLEIEVKTSFAVFITLYSCMMVQGAA